VGVEITQTLIPIDDQVEGACEMLGLDPLYVANEGIFIAVVPQNRAEEAISILKKFNAKAAIMGEIVENHPKQVILQSRIGGKRIVTMLPGEQLPRIC